MNTVLCLLLVLAASFGMQAYAQQFEYTNTQVGEGLIPLGYPVPIPVDSLTPIDGFRTYQALHLRHLQMSEQSATITRAQIGNTEYARSIWAYTLSDSNNHTESGALEGAALINGGIHAREWQSPEAVTGYMEYLFDHANDNYIAQYLLENLNLVIVPVLNIDGFIQTQRFPKQVTESATTPRDGRMRRKNMRDTDESLVTAFDNLNGVDLNRNNAPYWATNSQRSSGNVSSLVHHGSGPASESEIQALHQAAKLAKEDRLRFYTDTHSFTQIYFTPFTENPRRNDIAGRVATVMRAANNFKYDYGPSAAGGGIGATDEYFANTYQIPAYTLEIEPKTSGAEYGGFGVSHDGFILPGSEVARMRKETTMASLSGLYAMTEVPVLMSAQVWDASGENLVLSLRWQAESQSRVLQTLQSGELSSETDYQLHLTFNKPMRWLENGVLAPFPAVSEPLDIAIKLAGIANSSPVEWVLDAEDGEWRVSDNYHRYKTDTFVLPMRLPSAFNWQSHSLLFLEIDTHDFAGQKLDTNPATIPDWVDGGWQNYEDATGNASSDQGGVAKAMRFIDDGSDMYATSPPPSPPVTPPLPPSADTTGGGGSAGVIFVLIGLIGIWRTAISKSYGEDKQN
ncbi:hypothetical protein DRW07_14110 [Alteromonas sediminis]|uniref:Peptidase M14 domain-containing protein n=1 Tax=Alteromonas sediminis TaxID=2259342 RepID=A0A3N5Z9J1_9ALTE|nr:M14 family zinc carboxypeptidase [Alteromonas sediminis]RPJ65938.1 hypothetical protein DRW07_14110 [Alteromonas sediminis]